MSSDAAHPESRPDALEPRMHRWVRKIREQGIRRLIVAKILHLRYVAYRAFLNAVARLIKAGGNRVKAYGLEFAVDSPVVTPLQKYHLYRERHEFDEVRLLEARLDPTLPTIEFGGSMGVVACLTNRRLARPTDHVVVEANPRVVPVLEKNREINGCQFEIVQAAVGYGGPTVSFYFGDDCMTGTTCKPEGRKTTVPTVSLKSIVDDRGFERVNLIVDIEGGEIAMVANELETIKRRVRLLVLETHERYLQKGETAVMVRNLEEAGLEVVDGDRDDPFVLAFLNRNLEPGAAPAPSRALQDS